MQGRDKDHATRAAVVDALMQSDRAGVMRASVLGPLAAEAAGELNLYVWSDSIAPELIAKETQLWRDAMQEYQANASATREQVQEAEALYARMRAERDSGKTSIALHRGRVVRTGVRCPPRGLKMSSQKNCCMLRLYRRQKSAGVRAAKGWSM